MDIEFMIIFLVKHFHLYQAPFLSGEKCFCSDRVPVLPGVTYKCHDKVPFWDVGKVECNDDVLF